MLRSETMLINCINGEVKKNDDVEDDAAFFKFTLRFIIIYLRHLLATNELIEVGHLFLENWVLIVYLMKRRNE